MKKNTVFAISIILLILFLPYFTKNSFFIYVSILLFLNIIGAVSINLIMKTGQVSIAHAAFMAIGAYTTAILTTRLNLPFIYCFISSGIMSALIAIIIGRIFLRLRGDYFILGTFAFGEFLRQVIINNREFLGGANGIIGIAPPKIPFLTKPITMQIEYYYLAFVLMIVIVFLVYLIYRSPIGRIMDSINESEEITQSLGINVVFYKVLAFTVGASFVGLSGCLYAYFMHLVSPYDFQFTVSTGFILMNVIGGRLTLIGPIIGATILTPLPELFRQFVEYQIFFYATTVVLFVMYLPYGIAGIFRAKKIKNAKLFTSLANQVDTKKELL